MKKNIDRRTFLKRLGLGTAAVAAGSLVGCKKDATSQVSTDILAASAEVSADKMEYRTNPRNGDKVSLLGYGCMRWPTKQADEAADPENPELDQEMINKLVDYALAHGVNYFDTSPVYCRGLSEETTGIALARHPRDSYYIATKLSNFAPATWPRDESIKMYRNSLEKLQTDHIDYMLLHSIGGTATDADGRELTSEETFNARYIDNGMLDFLMAEREAGRIRNLGFSYHGDVKIFDKLLAEHDKYKWDFVQIQMNYVDWNHSKEINERNTDAEYLYGELSKRNIPVVVMEPLLGGRLAQVPEFAEEQMKQRRPEASIASWAFRFAGTPEGVLTVLSGMTYMEHLQDNLRSYAPFIPCTEEETAMLSDIAGKYAQAGLVNCTGCQYCMPCPYGIDIPSIFRHYNKMVNEGRYTERVTDPDYAASRRAFLVGYDRTVPALRQANHCIGCNQCTEHCPQNIEIPKELHRIDDHVEALKRNA